MHRVGPKYLGPPSRAAKYLAASSDACASSMLASAKGQPLRPPRYRYITMTSSWPQPRCVCVCVRRRRDASRGSRRGPPGRRNRVIPGTRPSIVTGMTGQPSCPTLGRAPPGYSPGGLFKPSRSFPLLLLLARRDGRRSSFASRNPSVGTGSRGLRSSFGCRLSSAGFATRVFRPPPSLFLARCDPQGTPGALCLTRDPAQLSLPPPYSR